MSEKGQVPLAVATLIADWALDRLAPFAERIEIAGSVRREKPVVGDVEILYVPRYEVSPKQDLFGYAPEHKTDLVDRELQSWLESGMVEKRLNSLGRPIGYGEKNKALVLTSSNVALDVFSTTMANWGMAMVVRTGPAAFNWAVMRRLKELGMDGHAYGGVTKGGKEVPIPEERDLFELMDLRWLAPNERNFEIFGYTVDDMPDYLKPKEATS